MIIHGKNLFPLSLTLVGAQGYFMDAAGEIWSERGRKGSLRKLAGTQTPGGRQVTLQTNVHLGFSPTYKCDHLQHEAKRHRDFAKHTMNLINLATAMGLKSESIMNRAHADSLATGITAKGWIIGTIADDAITIGVKPVIHTTEASVNDEITRLATLKPGVKFVKLRIEGALTVGAPVWE